MNPPYVYRLESLFKPCLAYNTGMDKEVGLNNFSHDPVAELVQI